MYKYISTACHVQNAPQCNMIVVGVGSEDYALKVCPKNEQLMRS